MLFSYVPFGVTVMVLGCPDYLQWGVPGAAKEEWRAGWLGPGEGGPGLILILLVVMRPVGCPHCLAWLLMEVCRLGMGVWKVGEQACQETNDM